MLKLTQRDNMKFKELREATLSKTQIKKVHDKADDLPKNDFIKRYGKEGDAVRFATATNIVKKKLGIEDYEEGFKSDAQRRAAFASGYKEKGKKKDEAIKGNDFVGVSSSSTEYKQGKQAAKDGKKYDDNPYKSGNREMNIKRLNWSSGHNNFREELDDKDKETIKPIIKQLQKSVKAHDKQAKQLQKDIQDEVEITEAVSDAYVKQIARMTDRNDPFGARFELARLMKDKQLMGFYDSLEKMHTTLPRGVIGNDAITIRQTLERLLRDRLKSKLKADADKLIDAL